MVYLIVTSDRELVNKAKESGADVFTAKKSCVFGTIDTQNLTEKPDFQWPKVDELLRQLAIQPNVRGYDFIRHILEKCESIPNYHKRSYTKEIYPDCAKAFGTTSSRVERAIMHAVENGFAAAPEVYYELFGFKEVPKNSQFISWASVYLTNCK